LAAQAAQPKSDVRGSIEFKRHIVYTFVTRALSNPQALAA
jgi:carbon-monoxide dehydrogenase medium subunit